MSLVWGPTLLSTHAPLTSWTHPPPSFFFSFGPLFLSFPSFFSFFPRFLSVLFLFFSFFLPWPPFFLSLSRQKAEIHKQILNKTWLWCQASDGPSPHSPSLRLRIPAPLPSRRHHAQSLRGSSFHDPRTHNVFESHPEQAAPLSRREDEKRHAVGSHSALALRLSDDLAVCNPSSSCRFWVLDHLCSNLFEYYKLLKKSTTGNFSSLSLSWTHEIYIKSCQTSAVVARLLSVWKNQVRLATSIIFAYRFQPQLDTYHKLDH